MGQFLIFWLIKEFRDSLWFFCHFSKLSSIWYLKATGVVYKGDGGGGEVGSRISLGQKIASIKRLLKFVRFYCKKVVSKQWKWVCFNGLYRYNIFGPNCPVTPTPPPSPPTCIYSLCQSLRFDKFANLRLNLNFRIFLLIPFV